MDLYWPGALTLVFTKSDLIPDTVTSNLTTVGLRMPNSKIALEILNKFGLCYKITTINHYLQILHTFFNLTKFILF